MIKLFFVCLMVASPTANAAIMFLNLNDSPSEIDAAKKAADMRGESLVVVPNKYLMSKTERSELKRLNKEKKRLNEQLSGKYGEEWKVLANKASEVEKQIGTITTSYRFKEEEFSGALKSLKNRGEHLSSLIVSGHSGGYYFSGSFGEVESDAIASMIKAQGMEENLKSIYLWGCYTATPAAALSWKKRLPTLNMIAGFNGKGPASENAASPSVLLGLLTKEKALTEQSEAKTTLSLMRQTEDINETLSAVMIRDCYFSPAKNRFKSAGELSGDCAEVQKLLNDLKAKYYDPYYSALPGFDDPPDAHDNNSKLRVFYNQLQSYGHCPKEVIGALPTVGQTLSLIFSKNVQTSFGSYFRNDINAANEILRKLGQGLKEECRPLPAFGASSTTRKQILEADENLYRCIKMSQNKLKPGELEKLKSVSDTMGRMLVKSNCVPMNWILDNPPSLEEPSKVAGCDDP